MLAVYHSDSFPALPGLSGIIVDSASEDSEENDGKENGSEENNSNNGYLRCENPAPKSEGV